MNSKNSKIYSLPLKVRNIIREVKKHSEEGSVDEDCFGNFYVAGCSWAMMHVRIEKEKIDLLKKYNILRLVREKEGGIEYYADTTTESIKKFWVLALEEQEGPTVI